MSRPRPAKQQADSAAPPPASRAASPLRPRFRLLYLLAIPALALAAYANSLQGEFVWDDRPLILDDHTVQSFAYLDEIFTNDFFSRHEFDVAYGYYRPLISLTYVLDHALWGGNAFGFHLTNVLVHTVATLLLVFLLRRLGFGAWVSLLAGILFAVHPMHTENVAWISGRTDVVSLALVLGAFLLHAWGADEAREGKRRIVTEAVVWILFALALLAKEMAIVLLPWVFLYHLRIHDWKVAARRILPLTGVFLLYAIWRFGVIEIAAPYQPDVHSVGAVVLSALPTVFRYLLWLVAPFGQNAYVQNPYVTSPADPRFLLPLLGAGAVAYALYRSFRTHRPACLVVLALFSCFLPLINLVRIGGPEDMGAVMAERFAYFPSAPFLALVAAGVGMLVRRSSSGEGGRRWAVQGAVVLLVGAMGVGTFARNRVWNNDLVLYEDMLDKSPEAPLIWSNLARHYIRFGDLEAAERTVATLSRVNDQSYYYRSAQVWLYVSKGDYGPAVPLQEEIVGQTVEENSAVWNNLAFLYQKTGRPREGIEILERLIDQGHSYAGIRFNLAQALQQDGRVEEARTQYRLATDLAPDDVEIGTEWSLLEMTARRFEEAAAILAALVRLHPDDATLHQNLAVVQVNAGREGEAERSFLRALAIDPGYAKARLSYGKFLQRRGEDAKAREQFEEVIRLAPGTEHARQARTYLQ